MVEGRGDGVIKFNFSVCLKVFQLQPKMLDGAKAGFVWHLVKSLLRIGWETGTKGPNTQINSFSHLCTADGYQSPRLAELVREGTPSGFPPTPMGPQIESGPEGRGESNTHQQQVPNRSSWLVGIAFKGVRSSSPSVYSQPGGRQIVCGLAWNLLMRDSTPRRCFKDTPEAECLPRCPPVP